MKWALERVLRGCKSNCWGFQATVRSRMTTRALKLRGDIRPIAGG
jgi:hypothetical protein